jgi:hypothetical protein
MACAVSTGRNISVASVSLASGRWMEKDAASAARVLPGEAARAVPTRGRLNVVVPVPIRRAEPPPAFNNAAASAAAAQPLGLATPARPVSAGGPALFEPSAAPRPWCENGNVVGGLCLLN